MAKTYTFEVGETVRIPLLLIEGNKDLITGVRANLKLTIGNKQIPAASVPADATCNILVSSLGWIIDVPASVTRTLRPGTYAVNVAMEITGTTVITEPSFVKLLQSTVV
jgi:hypothetical protein